MGAGRKADKAPARAGRTPSKPAARKADRPARPARTPVARAAKPARSASKPNAARAARRAAALAVDPALFEPLCEGERADALRVMAEDRRLANMAKIARYRVVAVEPLVLKPPHELSGHRLAKVVAFDYSADRTVEALIDLDAGVVAHLQLTQSQPALGREEESLAVNIALRDERVKRDLGLGDQPQAAMHYWSRRDNDLAYARRSAAVLFGQPGERPSMVAIVDLIDRQVTDVVAADQW
ncbi:MAG TPA: hypothetical protein VNO33_18765 [Kofleriaceae bacterium]|nr:hypothetical protein [Kofleriaceae bacterium]